MTNKTYFKSDNGLILASCNKKKWFNDKKLTIFNYFQINIEAIDFSGKKSIFVKYKDGENVFEVDLLDEIPLFLPEKKYSSNGYDVYILNGLEFRCEKNTKTIAKCIYSFEARNQKGDWFIKKDGEQYADIPINLLNLKNIFGEGETYNVFEH